MMATKPVVPMSPESLPQQFLYAVPVFPETPEHWVVDFNHAGVCLPARMSRSAKYLAQVEWAWSPMHSRIDAYHLSLNRSRDRWLLWLSFFDDEKWTFIDSHVAASAPRCRLNARDAGSLLLMAYWANEARGLMELDAPHWINESGLLDTACVKEIERRVWSPHDSEDASSEALSPAQMRAYQRMQEKMDQALIDMGAVRPDT